MSAIIAAATLQILQSAEHLFSKEDKKKYFLLKNKIYTSERPSEKDIKKILADTEELRKKAEVLVDNALKLKESVRRDNRILEEVGWSEDGNDYPEVTDNVQNSAPAPIIQSGVVVRKFDPVEFTAITGDVSTSINTQIFEEMENGNSIILIGPKTSSQNALLYTCLRHHHEQDTKTLILAVSSTDVKCAQKLLSELAIGAKSAVWIGGRKKSLLRHDAEIVIATIGKIKSMFEHDNDKVMEFVKGASILLVVDGSNVLQSMPPNMLNLIGSEMKWFVSSDKMTDAMGQFADEHISNMKVINMNVIPED